MLTIDIESGELWDEANQVFIQREARTLRLEHSLVSLSKWESIHQIPFLDGKQRTPEQILSYVSCMSVDGDLPREVLLTLSRDQLGKIIEYIESQQTATTFSNLQQAQGRREIITSELIYYWLVTYNIPFEVEHWHLNRLFTLIRVCNVKSSKPKKMSKSELAAQYRTLNEQRRRQLGTSG